jgi:hypothetical protein
MCSLLQLASGRASPAELQQAEAQLGKMSSRLAQLQEALAQAQSQAGSMAALLGFVGAAGLAVLSSQVLGSGSGGGNYEGSTAKSATADKAEPGEQQGGRDMAVLLPLPHARSVRLISQQPQLAGKRLGYIPSVSDSWDQTRVRSLLTDDAVPTQTLWLRLGCQGDSIT